MSNIQKQPNGRLEIPEDIRNSFERIDRHERIGSKLKKWWNEYALLLITLTAVCWSAWYAYTCFTRCRYINFWENVVGITISVPLITFSSYLIRKKWAGVIFLALLIPLFTFLLGSSFCSLQDYILVVDGKMKSDLFFAVPWNHSVQFIPKHSHRYLSQVRAKTKSGTTTTINIDSYSELVASRDDVLISTRQWPNPDIIITTQSEEIIVERARSWVSTKTDKELRDLADNVSIGADTLTTNLDTDRSVRVGKNGKFHPVRITVTVYL